MFGTLSGDWWTAGSPGCGRSPSHWPAASSAAPPPSAHPPTLQRPGGRAGVVEGLGRQKAEDKKGRRVFGPHPLYVHALGCELASSELLARVQLDAQLPDGGQI